jgi:hypothetical protein
MQQQGVDPVDGMLRFGTVARPDHEAVVAATDVSPLGENV